jgi:alpha-L-fucosidase 2
MTRGILLIDMAPADCWEDAFPVGNGRHGALMHGRPGAERVVITHHDLTWPALLAAAQATAAQLAGLDEGADPGAPRRWRELAARLPPYRLTADGALAEWAWPPAGTRTPPLPAHDEHRHVSHLYPVWPLHEITVAGTPALAAAALRALRARGAQDDSAHGYLHKALAAARLRDADLAGQLLAALAWEPR